MDGARWIAAVVLCATACSSGGGLGSAPVGHSSVRPLHLPTLSSGAPCPVSQAHHLSSTFAPGIGTGPAYAVGFKRGILRFEYPPDPKSQFAGSTWGGQKVLWVVKPSYHGALLIRGRRIDGPQALRFERGVDPPDELRLPIQPANLTGGWANYPSYTRLRAPGCYAYQVDGKAVSEVIVFRAVVSLNG